MYKVTFYCKPEENFVMFKWFKTFKEALKFAETKDEEIIEIKKYDNQTDNI